MSAGEGDSSCKGAMQYAFILVIVLMGMATSAFAGPETATPGVDWVLTGGTLSMIIDKGVRKNPDADWLLKNFPLRQDLKVDTIKLFSGGIDSSQMLSEDLETIVDTVGKSLAKGKVPLITQGTDSLATTGLILGQIFPDYLLVMTAAFRPIGEPNSDARENIEAAFLVAQSAKDPRIPKVPYAVMNGHVYLASSLVKLDIECEHNRRGFKSYYGSVGILKHDQIEWDADFLRTFEAERKEALKQTKELRKTLLSQVRAHAFKLAPVELGFVNQSTPTAYLNSMLDRLEKRESRALVLSGELGDQTDLLDRIEELTKRGLPIFIEKTSHQRFSSLQIPQGIQPKQAWSKLAVFVDRLPNPQALAVLLNQNIAGEVVDREIREDYKNELVVENFYETAAVSRGFLTYFQNLPLFRSALISELLRLDAVRKQGRNVELVIEGLGNGHIYVGGNHTPGQIGETLDSTESILNILGLAKHLNIQITILADPPDAVPNAQYEVGHRLQEAGAIFANLPGRRYLKNGD